MLITKEDIKKIANLAKLSITNDEITMYAEQLSNILKLAKEMEQVDTTSINTMSHGTDSSQPLREDKVTEENARQLIEPIAPEMKAGLYIVPQVIES